MKEKAPEAGNEERKELESGQKKKKKRTLRQRLAEKKLSLFVFLLVTAMLCVVAWPFFTVTVEAGHVGVYFSRFFGGTVRNKIYMEGLHFIFPWDLMIQYNRRVQSKDYNITALTQGGLSVTVDMSALWLLLPEDVSELHVTTGPDYRETVIDPAVMSAVRSTIGRYEQAELYDGNPLQLQNEVLELLSETFVNAPFVISAILIREVRLPDQMSAAISEKFVAEQGVLTERYRVLEAIEGFKTNSVNAESTRYEQSVVSEGLSEEYLRYMGIVATMELAKSDNAKLVIIGDKDGMPLILNPDTLETSPVLPEGLSPEEYIREGEEGGRADRMRETYDNIQENLDMIDGVLGALEDEFPVAGADIGESALPQDSQVPSAPGEAIAGGAPAVPAPATPSDAAAAGNTQNTQTPATP